MMCGKLVKSAIIVFLIIFSLHYYAFAGEAVPDQNKKNSELTVEQKAINKDRDRLKKTYLQSQQTRLSDPEVKGVEFEVGFNPIEGSSSARLIIVQFSDYSCSHCARHVKETYPEILKEYIITGKLRYVVVDYPLPGNLPAIKASEAALCANDQGKYWEMHDEIMFDQASLNDLTSIASFIDLDMEKFENCMKAEKYAGKVSANISLATKLKIPSVPGFILASTDPDNPQKVKGILYVRGAKPFEIFQQEIDKALENLIK